MKPLSEYITNALKENTNGTFIQFELEDLQQWDVWQPNDDITKEDCLAIGKAFYDNWPADNNDCGTINGLSVNCEHVRGTDTIKFTIFKHDEDEKLVISVVEEIVNMLTNTVYSVGPGKSAKRIIKSMLNKL